jgi:arylsulfatase A-like enzyme
MPTILALTGTPGPKNLDGVDLREFVGAPDSHKRIMFSENWRFDREGEFTKNQVAVFDGKHKLILNLMSEATSLRKQPKEDPKENLAGKLKAEALHRALDLFLEENSAVDLND